jgi:hypothetical protein
MTTLNREYRRTLLNYMIIHAELALWTITGKLAGSPVPL